MSRVTLQLIADQLGVSKFAVSRALAGKPGVSEKTREAVVSAAEELGYAPRRRGANGRSIEVLFHDRSVANRELWVDVQHGIEDEARRCGFAMTVRWTEDPTIVAGLEKTAVGFILVGPHDLAMHEEVCGSRRPAVAVGDRPPPLSTIDHIGAADVEAGVYVARFLAELGHRRMIFVHGQLGYPGRYRRLQGFADGLAEIEDADLKEISFETDYTPSGFRTALLEFLGGGFEPTAFLCGNDGVAVTVVSELMRMGLKVPEDISVVGYGDYPIATQVSPELTTMHQPHREMGVTAARLMLARAGLGTRVDDLPPQRISLVPHLVVRASSGPASLRSWRAKLRS